jgi:hypothetical protein
MAHVKERRTQTGHVADRLTDVERLFEIAQGGLIVAARVIDLGDVVEGGAFALFVADRLKDVERLFEIAQRGLIVAPRSIDLRDVVEGGAFALFVADRLERHVRV